MGRVSVSVGFSLSVVPGKLPKFKGVVYISARDRGGTSGPVEG